MKFCRSSQTFAAQIRAPSIVRLSLCGLSRLAGRTAGRLSGGERQRIAIAALFIPDVAAYLLDEPTMNLDPIGARLLVNRLAAARDAGRAVLFTTHATAELDELATGVATLRDGRIAVVAHESRPASAISQCRRRPSRVVGRHCTSRRRRRAWPSRGRLHAIVPDGAVSVLLGRLEHEGARVTSYRSESALAAALERLNEEEHHDEVARPHSVDRCVAAGRLWRGARLGPSRFRWTALTARAAAC